MMLPRFAVSSALGLLLAFGGATTIAHAEATNASANEIARACKEGRDKGVTAAIATVNGEQGTFFFYQGIGRQTAGNEQCTTYFLWLERIGDTVAIP
jgi:hypothetical protein